MPAGEPFVPVFRAIAASAVLLFVPHAAHTQPAAPIQLTYMCYSDGVECEVARDLLDRFHAAHPDVRVTVETVSFNVVREQLETRLNAGQGPDMARITNLGGMNRHYLDLRPYVDAERWERAFGPTLDWMRNGARDRGVYGFLTQLTVSGAFVNRTLFQRAGIPLPGPRATWDDWAAAVRTVRTRTSAYAGIAMDRSGHRFAGPAISYGARFLDEEGRPTPMDEGFRAFAERLIRWHREDLMPRDIWPSATGARIRSGTDMFVNGDAVMHVAGSWQVQRYAEAIGDRFDWIAVPNPCGPAACTGMPGGAAMVAFRRTRHPEAVARVMEFMTSEPVLKEFYERTLQIPSHRGLAERGLDYGAALAPAAVQALRLFAEEYRQVAPQAHRLQGYARNHIVFNAIADHVTQAIVGALTLDEAMRRIDADVLRGVR
jgi:alpha-1,4-digalacturonate transport system substrate-binding protein